ncbi:DUF6970 domain-containing protein [Chloroflexota bacterium]
MYPRYRVMLLAVILLPVLTLSLACGPAVTSPTSTTTTSQPTGTQDQNPDWLIDLMQKMKNEPVANPPASITQYEYKGQTVYYVPPRYADIPSTLYDKEGNVIGHPDGGMTGQGDGRARDFFDERKNERTIWTDSREHEPGMVQTLAPIVSVEINIAKSFPPQYFLRIVSGLPNSCVKFAGYRVERFDGRIMVEIINWKPADPEVMCAQVYENVETSINLGSDFKSGTKYTVDVNGVVETFTAQ